MDASSKTFNFEWQLIFFFICKKEKILIDQTFENPHHNHEKAFRACYETHPHTQIFIPVFCIWDFNMNKWKRLSNIGETFQMRKLLTQTNKKER